MKTDRTSAFSDGIFAIAATLLVLDIRLPDPANPRLVEALLQEWPAYLGYFASFAAIGIVWVNHHALVDCLAGVNRTLLFLNLLLLMTVGLVPFPTAFMAAAYREHAGLGVATVLYGLSMLAMASVFAATWTYLVMRSPQLLKPEVRNERSRMRKAWLGVVLYLITIGIALFLPPLAFGMYLAIAAWFVFPGRHVPAEPIGPSA